MKLSTKIILPIIIISALLILLNGCMGTVPDDESPGFTPGTITGIIASPCCSTSAEPVSETCCIAPEYWCFWCQQTWSLQDGIEVVLTYGEDEVATVFTNEDGEFTFTNVDPGKNYVVTAYCPDFADNRPLVKDVALELIEGGSFDTKITDLVSTSFGLVVDFLVLYTELGPEDIILEGVIADKPNFPNFPKFKKLVYEVRRVLENCEVNMLTDDDLQDALCLASEEVGRETDPDLVIGCSPGYTPPPPPPPDPCAGNVAPSLTMPADDTVDPDSGPYTWNVIASDDGIKQALSFSLVSVVPTPTNNFTVNPTSGQISWDPDCDDIDDGDTTYTITVKVDDGCAPVQGSFEVTLNDEPCDPCYNNVAPSLTMPADDTVDPDSGPYTWNVIASDDGIKQALSFSLVSVVPTPTNNFTVNPTSGQISWDPDCDDIDDGDTTYTITVKVDDGCAPVQGSFEVTLNDEPCDPCYNNVAPSLTMPANASVDPSAGPYTWNVIASDDGIKQALSFSLVSVVPTPTNNFTVNPTSGQISWDPDCDDIDDGDTTYTITVKVDDGCATTQDSFDVTLNAEPCECYGNTGPFLTMPADDTVDPDSGPYTWNVVGSDPDGILGTLSYSLVSVVPTPTNNFTVNPTSGQISWDPDCDDIVNREDTTYTITVEVDDGCATTQDSFDVTLNAEPCECYGNTGPFLTMPADDTVDPDSGPYTWNVVGSDPDGILGTLSYSLVSVVPTPTNNFTVNPTSGQISWDPDCDDIVNREDTTYTITVEVDDGCATTQDSFDVTLNAEPCEPCELAELTIFTNKVPLGWLIPVSSFTKTADHIYEYEYRIANNDNSLTFIPILSGNCEGVVHYQWKNEQCVGGIYIPTVPAAAISNAEYPTADVVPSKKFVVCNPPAYNILYLYVGEGTEQDIYKVIVRREDV